MRSSVSSQSMLKQGSRTIDQKDLEREWERELAGERLSLSKKACGSLKVRLQLFNAGFQLSTSECQLIPRSVKNNKSPLNTFLYKNNSKLQHVTWNDSLGKDVLKFFSIPSLIQAWNTSPWGGTREPVHTVQHKGLELSSPPTLILL